MIMPKLLTLPMILTQIVSVSSPALKCGWRMRLIGGSETAKLPRAALIKAINILEMSALRAFPNQKFPISAYPASVFRNGRYNVAPATNANLLQTLDFPTLRSLAELRRRGMRVVAVVAVLVCLVGVVPAWASVKSPFRERDGCYRDQHTTESAVVLNIESSITNAAKDNDDASPACNIGRAVRFVRKGGNHLIVSWAWKQNIRVLIVHKTVAPLLVGSKGVTPHRQRHWTDTNNLVKWRIKSHDEMPHVRSRFTSSICNLYLASNRQIIYGILGAGENRRYPSTVIFNSGSFSVPHGFPASVNGGAGEESGGDSGEHSDETKEDGKPPIPPFPAAMALLFGVPTFVLGMNKASFSVSLIGLALWGFGFVGMLMTIIWNVTQNG